MSMLGLVGSLMSAGGGEIEQLRREDVARQEKEADAQRRMNEMQQQYALQRGNAEYLAKFQQQLGRENMAYEDQFKNDPERVARERQQKLDDYTATAKAKLSTEGQVVPAGTDIVRYNEDGTVKDRVTGEATKAQLQYYKLMAGGAGGRSGGGSARADALDPRVKARIEFLSDVIKSGKDSADPAAQERVKSAYKELDEITRPVQDSSGRQDAFSGGASSVGADLMRAAADGQMARADLQALKGKVPDDLYSQLETILGRRQELAKPGPVSSNQPLPEPPPSVAPEQRESWFRRFAKQHPNSGIAKLVAASEQDSRLGAWLRGEGPLVDLRPSGIVNRAVADAGSKG